MVLLIRFGNQFATANLNRRGLRASAERGKDAVHRSLLHVGYDPGGICRGCGSNLGGTVMDTRNEAVEALKNLIANRRICERHKDMGKVAACQYIEILDERIDRRLEELSA